MKTIFLIRHDKSSLSFSDISDFDRPLNDRGHNDAPNMAERILKRNLNIDLFVTSTALRARQTCEHFCKALAVKLQDIILIDRLYHASPETIKNVIASLDNRYKSVAIFTHNPGITEFVNELVPDVRIDNMPTCGIFCVESDINDWKNFLSEKKKFVFFDYPKL